jgi:hypothetical protein
LHSSAARGEHVGGLTEPCWRVDVAEAATDLVGLEGAAGLAGDDAGRGRDLEGDLGVADGGSLGFSWAEPSPRVQRGGEVGGDLGLGVQTGREWKSLIMSMRLADKVKSPR